MSFHVGIVVVNYNGLEYSCACIDSLLSMNGTTHDIILVDNGSTDGSGEVIFRRYGDGIVYVSLSENGGVTRGNNAGIVQAKQLGCDYVLFLNNDTEVEPDFLDVMLKASIRDGLCLVVPKIVCAFDRARLDHWIGIEYDWWRSKPQDHKLYPVDVPEYDVGRQIKVASTCCLLVPIGVFAAIGGMDEQYFMYYDDADFTIRASRAGYRIMYEPKARIYHKGSGSTTQQASFFQYYLLTRNVFYFYRKLCPDPLAKIYFLSCTYLHAWAAFLRATLTGNYRRRDVLYLTMKDILLCRMGGLPDNFVGRKVRK